MDPAAFQEDVPGEAQALAQESQGRDLAFLLDTPEILCGVPVLPLDLRSLLLLTEAGNAFVCGGAADREDVRMLLWLQSPFFVAWPDHCRRVAAGSMARWLPRRWLPSYAGWTDPRRRFIETLPVRDELQACADIRTWIEATFADAPTGSKPTGLGGDAPIASFVGSWVDLLGSEYGWTEQAIVGTPEQRGVSLRRLYQYQRLVLRRHDPKRSFHSAAVARLHDWWYFGGGMEAALSAQPVPPTAEPATTPAP